MWQHPYEWLMQRETPEERLERISYMFGSDMFLTWEEQLLRRAGLLPGDDELPYDGPMTTVGECAREAAEVKP